MILVLPDQEKVTTFWSNIHLHECYPYVLMTYGLVTCVIVAQGPFINVLMIIVLVAFLTLPLQIGVAGAVLQTEM